MPVAAQDTRAGVFSLIVRQLATSEPFARSRTSRCSAPGRVLRPFRVPSGTNARTPMASTALASDASKSVSKIPIVTSRPSAVVALCLSSRGTWPSHGGSPVTKHCGPGDAGQRTDEGPGATAAPRYAEYELIRFGKWVEQRGGVFTRQVGYRPEFVIACRR
jgi:hypothetical protein